MTRRVRIDLEYDGTGFCGWQLQPGVTTVQGTLEDALGVLHSGRKIRVTGAGRTDAGVHATGQVAHAVLPDARYTVERLCHALNALTPEEIVVHRVCEVPATFDARRSACWRAYRYRLSASRLACGRQYVWSVAEPLSWRLLSRCAEALPGSHSFTSFCVASSAGKGTVCRILEARWRRRGTEFHFDIRGNRFVHGMVRSLVGTMVAVASGRMTVEDFKLLLLRPARGRSAPPAPAHGLTLVKVAYAGEE